jgi:hypothetical protein
VRDPERDGIRLRGAHDDEPTHEPPKLVEDLVEWGRRESFCTYRKFEGFRTVAVGLRL